MGRLAEIRRQRDELLEAAARHGARNVRIFGSVARGTDSTSSDVDLLVSLDPGRSLLDLADLYVELQALLGDRIDLVSERGLSPHLRERILREAVPL